MAQHGKAEEVLQYQSSRRQQREAEAWLRDDGAAAVEAVAPPKASARCASTWATGFSSSRNKDGSVGRFLHARISWLGRNRERGLGSWPCDLITASRAVWQFRLEAARANDAKRAEDVSWGIGGLKRRRRQRQSVTDNVEG
jgi:hypothetical protein